MTFTQMDLWKDHIDDHWLSFEAARAIVHSLGLEYEEDWASYLSEPNSYKHTGIPQNPEFIYRHTGWKGWKDWLVAPDRRVSYNTFNEAQEFTWCLKLPDEQAWMQYIQQAAPLHKSYGLHIPAKPYIEYRGNGWVDWNDWLGKNIAFRNYEDTRKFVRTLKLKSRGEWDLYCRGQLIGSGRKPKAIYRYPEIAYQGKGWINWEDWLGIH